MRLRFVPTLLLLLGGCSTFQDWQYAGYNHMRASVAYQFSDAPGVHILPSHYGSGWRAGFYDVTMGRDGTPPLVSPAKYWAPRFQSPEGQSLVQEWYRGYQDGVVAAEQRGHQYWHDVPSFLQGDVCPVIEEPAQPYSYTDVGTGLPPQTPAELLDAEPGVSSPLPQPYPSDAPGTQGAIETGPIPTPGDNFPGGTPPQPPAGAPEEVQVDLSRMVTPAFPYVRNASGYSTPGVALPQFAPAGLRRLPPPPEDLNPGRAPRPHPGVEHGSSLEQH